jgi:hypothetical protein
MQFKCIPLTIPSELASSGAKHARAYGGVTSDALLDYAATCEEYRSQRIRLESFIADERK